MLCILALIHVSSSCSNAPNTGVVNGEYLLVIAKTAEANNVIIDKLKNDFTKLSVSEVKKIGKHIYFLKFKDDPGIKTLKKAAKNKPYIKDIEPNKIVKLSPQPEKKRRKRRFQIMKFRKPLGR